MCSKSGCREPGVTWVWHKLDEHAASVAQLGLQACITT